MSTWLSSSPSPTIDWYAQGGVNYVWENFANDGTNEHVALRLAYHYDKKLNELGLAPVKDRLAAIDAKLQEWGRKMLPFKGANVVAYHDSWIYFAHRFGFDSLDGADLPGVRARVDAALSGAQSNSGFAGTRGKRPSAGGRKFSTVRKIRRSELSRCSSKARRLTGPSRSSDAIASVQASISISTRPLLFQAHCQAAVMSS